MVHDSEVFRFSAHRQIHVLLCDSVMLIVREDLLDSPVDGAEIDVLSPLSVLDLYIIAVIRLLDTSRGRGARR